MLPLRAIIADTCCYFRYYVDAADMLLLPHARQPPFFMMRVFDFSFLFFRLFSPAALFVPPLPIAARHHYRLFIFCHFLFLPFPLLFTSMFIDRLDCHAFFQPSSYFPFLPCRLTPWSLTFIFSVHAQEGVRAR